MQLKKNPRDPRGPGDGFPGSSSNFEEETADSNDYQVPPGMGSEHDTLVTRQREAAPAARSESVIDANSRFDGKFETDQDMRVEGSIAGDVICRGKLTIEREASAKAKLEARDLVIKGRVEGDLVCSGKLQLASTAEVTGTIKAGTLVVEEGAVVSGNVEIGQANSQTPASLSSRRTESAPGNASNSTEPDRQAAAGGGTANRPRREVPSFALVSSEERLAQDRN